METPRSNAVDPCIDTKRSESNVRTPRIFRVGSVDAMAVFTAMKATAMMHRIDFILFSVKTSSSNLKGGRKYQILKFFTFFVLRGCCHVEVWMSDMSHGEN